MGRNLIEHQGRKLPSHEWSKITGVQAGTIRNRLHDGWPIERALTERTFHLPIETLEIISKAIQSGKFETPEQVIEAAVKAFLK